MLGEDKETAMMICEYPGCHRTQAHKRRLCERHVEEAIAALIARPPPVEVFVLLHEDYTPPEYGSAVTAVAVYPDPDSAMAEASKDPGRRWAVRTPYVANVLNNQPEQPISSDLAARLERSCVCGWLRSSGEAALADIIERGGHRTTPPARHEPAPVDSQQAAVERGRALWKAAETRARLSVLESESYIAALAIYDEWAKCYPESDDEDAHDPEVDCRLIRVLENLIDASSPPVRSEHSDCVPRGIIEALMEANGAVGANATEDGEITDMEIWEDWVSKRDTVLRTLGWPVPEETKR